jgi:hypothetical protein
MASLATVSEPLPVNNTNGRSGWVSRTVERNSIPVCTGMS